MSISSTPMIGNVVEMPHVATLRTQLELVIAAQGIEAEIRAATNFTEAYQLWCELRTLERRLSDLADHAAGRCDALMEDR
jgi:hypothetical protein